MPKTYAERMKKSTKKMSKTSKRPAAKSGTKNPKKSRTHSY